MSPMVTRLFECEQQEARWGGEEGFYEGKDGGLKNLREFSCCESK